MYSNLFHRLLFTFISTDGVVPRCLLNFEMCMKLYIVFN
jgi:hypothetical protein